MKKIIAAAAAMLMTAGCSTVTTWQATGGSKADGVVRLSYEVTEFQKVQLNESQAIGLATQRCASWGYSGAEAFGGTTRQCGQSGGFGGCAMWVVTKEYQCTGEHPKSAALPRTESYVFPSQRQGQ